VHNSCFSLERHWSNTSSRSTPGDYIPMKGQANTYTHFGSGVPQSAQNLFPPWCIRFVSLLWGPSDW